MWHFQKGLESSSDGRGWAKGLGNALLVCGCVGAGTIYVQYTVQYVVCFVLSPCGENAGLDIALFTACEPPRSLRHRRQQTDSNGTMSLYCMT